MSFLCYLSNCKIMKDDIKNIKCPNCGESISIDDVLTHQIENKLKKDFEEKEKDMRASIEKESSEKLEKEKAGLEKKLKAQILKDAEAEKVASEEKNLLLEEQLAEKDAKLKEARQNELVLIKGNQKLKDDQESFELEKTRQLAEERKQIEEEASKKATDAKQSEIDQINKKLSDVTKAKDELARKLEQGSQQTQGEVQEIKLEELLKAEFIHDDISPVPKGVTGADVIQTVKTKAGVECGKIIWESKKTKSWTEGWIPKLKEDQRSVKADIAIIVSSVLPNGVEGIVETFSNMKSSLDKERIYFEKSWAEKEKQIQKVIKNTVGIYGDLSGVVQLQKIESLELPAPKTDKEKY